MKLHQIFILRRWSSVKCKSPKVKTNKMNWHWRSYKRRFPKNLICFYLYFDLRLMPHFHDKKMAQNPNFKFLYHIICMLITVMLLDSEELKTLSILLFMWSGWLFWWCFSKVVPSFRHIFFLLIHCSKLKTGNAGIEKEISYFNKMWLGSACQC